MKIYSIHLCGLNDNGKHLRECEDIELSAETRELAKTYAIARYPEFKKVRVQSEWDNVKEDWIDYE